MPFDTPKNSEELNQSKGPVRYIHQSTGHTMVKVSAGEIFVTDGDELITTVLGSCVAVCMRNTRTGVGGMNHFMLPGTVSEGRIQSGKEVANTARYGTVAMEALIASLLNPGGTAADLEAKVFGGARVVELSSEIGTMNIVFALKYLRDQKINIVVKDVGADYPRKLIYDPKTGITKMQRLRSAYRGYVAQNERRNLDSLIASPKPPGKAT